MPKDYNPLKAKIADAISHFDKSRALLAATQRSRNARAIQLESLQGTESTLLEEVKDLKRRSVTNLERLVAEFSSNCEKNGAKVQFAKSGKEVVDYILEIAQRKNVGLIGKSKSLTTEEIELNHYLEARGLT